MLKLRLGTLKGRSAAFLLVVVAFALALGAACGDDDDTGASASAAAAAQAAAQAAEAETAAAETAAQSAQAEAAAARAEAEAAQAAVAGAETEAEAAAARATAAEAETRAAEAEARAAAAAPAAEGIVQIGLPFELSGVWTVYGIAEANGVRLATKEMNSGHELCDFCEPGGGIRIGDTVYRIELVERDIRSETAPAIAAANELIDDIGVNFIIGPALDQFAIKIQELTNPRKVIMLGSPSVFTDILTLESVSFDGPLETTKRYLFKTHSENPVREKIIVEGAINLINTVLPGTSKSVILISDDAAGKSIGPSAQTAMENAGHEVELLYYPPGTTDFGSFLTRVKELEPDIVQLWYNPDDAMVQIQQAQEFAVGPAYFMYGVDPGAFRQLFPDGLDVPVVVACIPKCWGEASSQKATDYWDRWVKAGYPLTPAGATSLLYYDFTYMLAKAWKDAGTVTDTDAIVRALEKVERDGVMGQLKFNDRHIANHGFDLCLQLNNEWDCEFVLPSDVGFTD